MVGISAFMQVMASSTLWICSKRCDGTSCRNKEFLYCFHAVYIGTHLDDDVEYTGP